MRTHLLVALCTAAACAPAPAGVEEPSDVDVAAAFTRDIQRARPLTDRQARILGVGRWVPNLKMTDLSGNTVPLSKRMGSVATVLVMRDAGCPLCKKVGPTLAELEEAYAGKGVRFIYVNSSKVDDAAAMSGEVENYGFRGDYVSDKEGAIAGALGARTTTEAYVLDAAGTVVYRGAVDDRLGLSANRPAADHAFLADALDAVIGGETIKVKASIAPGCLIGPGAGVRMPERPTYHNAVSRILQTSCVSCHREGGAGPFVLDSYEQASGRSAMLGFVVEEGIMPPWDAAAHTGPWVNNMALAPEERQTLIDWIAAGTPEGDPADAPVARAWPTGGWQMGEPDVVYEVPDATRIPASGAIDYVYHYVQTESNKERWVQAVEFQTDAPEVMHHALVFVEEPRRESESDRRFFKRWNGGLEGYFAGLIPGQGPMWFPEGYGQRLKRRAWLKFQLHYTPNGTRQTDKIRVGFKFADKKPERRIEISGIGDIEFVVPAGAENHVVVAEDRINRNKVIDGFSPHMHFRGKSYKYELITPDGEEVLLLDVPTYDYNWQHFYELAEPIEVERGSKIRCTAVFDNSANNPQNPDPTKDVRFGEQTWDEMMIGYYRWWPNPNRTPLLPPPAPGG